MMGKLVFTAMAIALSGILPAIEIDGLCTENVLMLEKAKHLYLDDKEASSLEAQEKAFYQRSLGRAIKHYKKFISRDDRLDMRVNLKALLFDNTYVQGEFQEILIGVKIGIYNEISPGALDQATYYFLRPLFNDKPALLMYFHDEGDYGVENWHNPKPLTAHWICERP